MESDSDTDDYYVHKMPNTNPQPVLKKEQEKKKPDCSGSRISAAATASSSSSNSTLTGDTKRNRSTIPNNPQMAKRTKIVPRVTQSKGASSTQSCKKRPLPLPTAQSKRGPGDSTGANGGTTNIDAEEDESSDDEDIKEVRNQDADDSMSGSNSCTSSEEDEDEEDEDEDAGDEDKRQMTSIAPPNKKNACEDVATGIPVFVASTKSREALKNLQTALLSITDGSNNTLSYGSSECVSSAKNVSALAGNLDESIDTSNANDLLTGTAEVATHLAKGMRLAAENTAPDVSDFRNTVSELVDVWDELLPTLEQLKQQTQEQAERATRTALLATEVYTKHLGMLSTVTHSIQRLKKQ